MLTITQGLPAAISRPALQTAPQPQAGPTDSVTLSIPGGAIAPPPGPPTLSSSIEEAVASDPNMKVAHWGMVVQDDQGKVIYQHDADHLFAPASNMKMITAATATHILGPQSRFQTHLFSDGHVDAQGVLQGNLYLVGGGDPSLATADLKAAAASVGFKKIAGNVVVDNHKFDNTHLGTGWTWDDFSANYGAEVDALTVNEGTAELNVSAQNVTVDPKTNYLTIHNEAKTGSSTELDVERELGANIVNISGTLAPGEHRNVAVSVHDPAAYAGTVLKTLCEDRGVAISGQVVHGVAPAAANPLWQKSSDPLISLEKHMLKESDNLYAETLFRALADGQSSKAPDIEKQTLNLSGPSRIVDGSGLSRLALISPTMLGGVVQKYYRDPGLRDCLPVAGVDGTLKKRMGNLRGRVEAKTGTMGGVSTLSGWLTAQDGKQYSFAWMCNDYPGLVHGAKDTEDKVLTAMDNNLSHHS